MRKLLLAFLLIFSALLLLFLYSNRSRPSESSRTQPPKGKLNISQQELDEAYQLEKFLNLPTELATASSLPKPLALEESSAAAVPIETTLKEIAHERVLRRKILEAEALPLKIGVKGIEEEAKLTAGETNDGRMLPPQLSGLYSYDNLLTAAFKEKIEGVLSGDLFTVSFSGESNRTKAKDISQALFDFIKANPLERSENFSTGQKTPPEIKITQNRFKLATDDSQKIETSTEPTLVLSPTGGEYNFKIINRQEKGLGLKFTDWYQQIRKKYL